MVCFNLRFKERIMTNRPLRNKVLIKGKLLFAGGFPKWKYWPSIVSWGDATSIFWLGHELVYFRRRR